jgi:hypothetical protein
MMLRGHNSIMAKGRAARLKGEWRLSNPASLELNTCPNTQSHLGILLDGFNGAGSARLIQQLPDYSQSVR